VEAAEAAVKSKRWNKVSKYFAADGSMTEAWPEDLRTEPDPIDAAIRSHEDRKAIRFEAAKWGGVLEDHANAGEPIVGCPCPVCALKVAERGRAEAAENRAKAAQERVVGLEKEVKVLRDENREHRRAHGPQGEKAKKEKGKAECPDKLKK
jgi:hypothetical protein